MVNGMHSVFVEKNGKLEKTNAQFANEEEILNIINRIVNKVGRRVDESSPLVDARLPDGSRVNAIIAPLSLSGPILTIRRFPPEPFTLEKLVALQTLTSQMAEFLQNAIRTKQNIVISGGAGVGKTTTLNAIASTIPHTERLIIIEDAAEMRLQHPHLVSLETRPPNIEGKGEIPMRILVKNALRMRPDRIIIGEIRGGEALDMLQAMNTGHKGSLTTVHANTPLDALMRVETMALMADIDLPLFAIQEQIKSAINIIVQQERTSTGERRITKICELQNVPSANVRQRYTLKELF
jgi:pilus assembly protein CpaF